MVVEVGKNKTKKQTAVKAVETHCGTCCCASNGDGCGGQEGNTADCGCGMLLVVCTCVRERVCVCVACCSKPRVESVSLGTPELEHKLDQTFSTESPRSTAEQKPGGTETHLERNCTATQTPAYMRPLMSQESMSRSAMKPTSQMTTNGVPSITFCRNS